MSSGTIITDYLGRGTFANRPVTPPVPTGGTAFYYTTDTAVLYLWNGTVWINDAGVSAQWTVTGAISTEAAAFASRGNVFTPNVNMSITSVTALITTVNSGVYKIGIAPYNTGTNKLTSAPTYSTIYTEGGGTGAANKPVTCTFATPFAMTAGTAYLIFIVRTDATSTTSLSVTFGTGPFVAPGVYIPNTNTAFTLASLAPGTGDTWTTDGNGVYSLMPTYTIP